MKKYDINTFKSGWFIGDFEPSLLKTKDFEVAVKNYKRGDEELSHVHKIAKEYTMILFGSVVINDQIFTAGDIVEIEPGEYARFKALEDCTTLVVKTPSVKGDKYVRE